MLATAAGHAQDRHLTVEGPWIRFILPSLPAAGYFTLANSGDEVRFLLGASSPACGSLTLHRTISGGGTERMEMEPKVAIPAHGKVTFAPGGRHLMCTAASAELRPGVSVPVSLPFADGSELTVAFSVRGAAGR